MGPFQRHCRFDPGRSRKGVDWSGSPVSPPGGAGDPTRHCRFDPGRSWRVQLRWGAVQVSFHRCSEALVLCSPGLPVVGRGTIAPKTPRIDRGGNQGRHCSTPPLLLLVFTPAAFSAPYPGLLSKAFKAKACFVPSSCTCAQRRKSRSRFPLGPRFNSAKPLRQRVFLFLSPPVVACVAVAKIWLR